MRSARCVRARAWMESMLHVDFDFDWFSACFLQIFVEFKEAAESQKASEALGGRSFNGSRVGASFYSEESYAQKDLK